MENASKALIIAGAILLAILLISLGIFIFNQAQNAINGSGMTDAELTAFNQKFTKYQGRQKGSTIRTMVQEVMSNNNNAEASDETRVTVNVAITGTNGLALTSNTSNPALVSLGLAANSQPTYGTTFSNTTTYTVTPRYINGRVAILEVR